MMIKITNKMKNFIKEQENTAFVSTSDSKGINNVAPKTLLEIDDITITFGDLYVDRTAENLLHNNHLTIAVIDINECKGYQFKGASKIITKGTVYGQVKKRFDELGFSEPVHAIELTVEEIYLFEQSPEAKMEAA